MKQSALPVIVSLAMALSACSQTLPSGASGPSYGRPYNRTISLSELTRQEWRVEDIMNGGIIDFSHATLNFSEDGMLSGSASCNTYGGTFEITPEGLIIGPLRVTRRACAPALMYQEQRFLKVLSQPLALSVDETEQLTLKSSAGTISAR